MCWYEKINFFSVEMVNKKNVDWWTTLSLEEAKKAIGGNDFVTISSQRNEDYKEADYNTKAILTIKNYTEQNRKMFKHNEEVIAKKFEIVKKIRSMKPSYFVKSRINQTDTRYAEKELSWYDRHAGVDLDPLLIYQKWELEKMLRKCK